MDVIKYLFRMSLFYITTRFNRIKDFPTPDFPNIFKLYRPFFVCLLIATIFVLLLFQFTELHQEAVFMAGIFIFAASLWTSEAIPPFATSIVVVGLEILLLANPAGWQNFGFAGGQSPAYAVFTQSIADPVIMLFFGGFLLSAAAVKEGVDRALARVILKYFGGSASLLLLGVMIVTAFFSMWMSNTATAAMMITLTIPLSANLSRDDKFRKALVLAVAFAANIGGLATPVGSPPNAVAMGFMQRAGVNVSFLEWFAIGLPITILMIFAAWRLLLKLFPPENKNFIINFKDEKITRRGKYVIYIFGATIALWLGEGVIGLPATVVTLLPAIAFTATGIINRQDVNTLEWNVLIIIAGGISLGAGMQLTGLDILMVEYLADISNFLGASILVAFVVMAMLFSSFVSNTAAANLLLPLAITYAMSAKSDTAELAAMLAISIALAASVAMPLPISTPPNAIAYSTNAVTVKEMAFSGSILGIIAMVLVLTFGTVLIAIMF